MKIEIEYINNTCDIEELSGFGEIMIILKDGIPVFHHDYSDDALDLNYVVPILEQFGIGIKLKNINPDKKTTKLVKKYLEKYYGPVD